MKFFLILLTLIFNVLNTHVIAQEVDCVDDPDGMVAQYGSSCSELAILGCNSDLSDFIPGIGFGISVYEICPESCNECGDEIEGCTDLEACNYNPDATEDDGSCEYPVIGADCDGDCLQGYTELTLMWSGGVNSSTVSSFSITGDESGVLYSATLETESGSITECWMTDLQEDCFTVDIVGPDGLEWSIYSPLSDDPFLTGINESLVIGPLCAVGCTDMNACNYNPEAIEDDGSCIEPYFENGIQCDDCCMFEDGTWTHVNVFGLASDATPTVYAEGLDWSLTSSAFLYSEEVINADNSITTTSWFGSDDGDNTAYLTSDCFAGEVTLVFIFKNVNNTIVGDIVVKMYDDAGMYFETITSVDSFDLNTATMTGTIVGGFSGVLVTVDSDEDGVGDCDESISIEENTLSRELVKTINILGQDISHYNEKSILLNIYDDGSVEKQKILR